MKRLINEVFNLTWQQWVFKWDFKLPFSLNFFEQPGKLQEKGFSPVWVSIWTLSLFLRLNAAWQRWHLYGFTLVCLFRWSINCPFVLKLLPQPGNLQEKGLSFVWIRIWTFKFPFSLNFFEQYEQQNGLSPV